MEECAVCMDAEPNVKLFPCLHTLCTLCAVKLKLCPLCRASIQRRYASAPEFEAKVLDTFTSIRRPYKKLFLAVGRVITGSDPSIVAGKIHQIRGMMKYKVMSLENTETVLRKAELAGLLNYEVQNAVVRLCIKPWLVDVKLGGCGVCYHGNLGHPPDLHSAIQLKHYNA
jgi:Zinc finger, C3HC4 type (RING finger)